jgi:hypothetical protein
LPPARSGRRWKEEWVTSHRAPLEGILPQDLLKEMEEVAAAEGRGVEAVVAAAVRRYLWDATFRKLRRFAQGRARAQGWVSDEAVLTTVLARRRPDEYSLQKPTRPVEAIDEAEDSADAETTRSAAPATRTPSAESRAHTIAQEAAPARESARQEVPLRHGRRRGQRPREVSTRSTGAADIPRPTPAPGRSDRFMSAEAEAIRRRTESVHRFLPLDPSERDEQGVQFEETGGEVKVAHSQEQQPTQAPSSLPSPPSPVSEADSQASQPASQDEPKRRRAQRTTPNIPEPAATQDTQPGAPAMAYGRKPKRGGRRGP